MSEERGSESAESRSQTIKEDEMAEEKQVPRKLSRRDFVKGAAAVAGVGALASCAPAATPAPAETAAPCPTCPPAAECTPCPAPGVPETWDQETDVLVVGYGGAGGCAAVAAHQAGADVLVLEKAPEGEEGGNTRVSGNRWFHPSPVDKAIEYLNACADGYPIPQELVTVWAEEMGKTNDWLIPLGFTPCLFTTEPEYPELPGADCSAKYVNSDVCTSGQQLFWLKLKSVVEEDLGIKVLYGTPAKSLVQNLETKEILGVIAESDGQPMSIKARKAVILACGGFENNQQMIRDFLSRRSMAPRGTPYNTGDGIVMAQAAGAALWHMDAQSGMAHGFHYPGTDCGVSISTKTDNWITVDGTGQRFINEDIRAQHGYVPLNGVWTPRPCPETIYGIFDETARLAGPLTTLEPALSGGWVGIVLGLLWSEDNSDEIDEGWIIKADTVSELATKIELDPAALEETVSKYNGYCATGVDAEFGRPADGLAPIETAPFYAIPLGPVMLNTQGGPKHNEKTQVLDTADSAIPRLYAAGECGAIYSYLYPGAGNVGEDIAFGRVAGRNAAALDSWA